MTEWDTGDLLAGIERTRKAAREGAAAGLNLAGEHIIGVARDHAPHEEGTLERSGATRTDDQGLRTVVFFDGPYAVIQHEDLTFRHDAGRTAKYLENAINSEADTAGKIITTQVRTHIERG